MRDGWTQTTLGDVASVGPKEPPLSIDDPFVPMDAVSTDGRWVEYTEPRGSRSGARAAAEDVLFARITPCLENGKVAQVPPGIERCGGSTELLVIRPSQQTIPAFIYYWAKSASTRALATRLMTGSTGRQRLSSQDLAALPIRLPPLSDQRRIVDLIESVDSYIETLRVQADAARTARTSLLHELLYADDDDWTDTVLSDLLRRSIGGVWGSEEGSEEVDVTVVRSTEFTSSGYLNFATGVRRSCTARQLASRELQEGDILLEKSGGGPKQPVGRVVYVTDEIPKDTVCANFVQLVSPDPEAVCPGFVFLLMWLWHSEGRTLGYQAQTTGIRNLRTKDYLAQTIRLPPRAGQERIVDIASAVGDLVTASKEAIAATTRLRNGLLSELLSGDHEIPESYDLLLEAS